MSGSEGNLWLFRNKRTFDLDNEESDTVIGCSRQLQAATCRALDNRNQQQLITGVFEGLRCAKRSNVSEVVVESDNWDVIDLLSAPGRRESNRVSDAMSMLFPLNSFEPRTFLYPPDKTKHFSLFSTLFMAPPLTPPTHNFHQISGGDVTSVVGNSQPFDDNLLTDI
ncbi:hypothetical protein V6N11_068096 [Hibiscus sabdariffa]|uniref:RNase H type-1 domain-containing protein n=1 Tax=Hibiscus sabdariffa TaxID=183260 RepID=A0ABR2ST07_9ROSI